MEGYLDHLETISHVGMRKSVWIRRYFKLNAVFGVLEFFNNEMQQERKGKLELNGAVVLTADELGELLSDSKAAVEKTRRFIFRITENGSKKDHYLCAEFNGSNAPPSLGYAKASSSREYLGTWLHALRTTIAVQENPSISSATLGLSELNLQMGAFMNHMHLSARVSSRIHTKGKSIYEIIVKAWILEREIVMEDDDRSYSHGSISSGEMAWQILEYSCAWKLVKSTAELQSFDNQLRLLFGAKMHTITFPPSSFGTKLQHLHLHASASQKEAENTQRLHVYDAYLQSLLRLPTFSSFGSDASTMLDTFLDISPHLASFRKLEKESGQNMHLSDRNIVPWKDRERFEVIYKMHLQVIAVQEENARRVEMNQTRAKSRRKESRRGQQQYHRHIQHHQEGNEQIVYADAHEYDQFSAGVAPLPTPVKLTAATEEARSSEAVKERIARFGQRLIIEAFDA